MAKEGGDAEKEGTMFHPRFTAWKLPDTKSRFFYHERNSLGNPTNQVETYTDPSDDTNIKARTNAFTYATNGIDLLKHVNEAGVQVSSNYFNAYHQVVTNYNAMNEVTVFTYNANHQPLTIAAPSGLNTTYTYDTSGTWSNFLTKTVDAEIKSTNTYTHSGGLVQTHTDDRGVARTFMYDALGRVRRVSFPDSYVTNHYDNFNLIRVTDRMGFASTNEYNGFGQVTRQINARGKTNTLTYCNCGILDSTTDAEGKATSFTHDYLGQRTQITYPGGTTVSYKYDLMGRVTNVIDSAGVSVTNCYNNQGLVCVASNAFGQVSKTMFDVEDNPIQVTDVNSVTITNTYDKLRRLLTRGFPAGGVEKHGYTLNVAGLTTYTNQLNSHVYDYGYDAGGRRTNEACMGICTNSFAYDCSGNLTNLVDGKSQKTSWLYDEYSRVTNKLDNAGTVILRYTYNANGWLLTRWSLAKGTTTYGYDAVGNLTSVNYPANTNLTLQYDGNNRLTNIVDALGTTRYSYTAFGALESEDGPWANDTVTYAYNSSRTRSSLSLLQPNASDWTNGYSYDASGRLKTLTSQAGAFTYDYKVGQASSLPIRLSLPGGSYITNAYDADMRLTNTWLKTSAGTILNSHGYLVNGANQRTKQTFKDGNYADYTYDNSGQLMSAKGKESGGSPSRSHEQLSYVYDQAGNLNYRTNNALVHTFNVNSSNQLTTITRSGTLTVAGTTSSSSTNVTIKTATQTNSMTPYLDNSFAAAGFNLSDGDNTFTAVAQDSLGRADTNAATVYLPATASFVYDLNGNLTSDGKRGLEYDDENQLIRVTVTNSWKSEFTYDGKMRRRLRKEYMWQSSAWLLTNEVRYVYDGMLAIQERDANNLPMVSYTRGNDLGGTLEGAGGIGGLLARTANSQLLSPNAHAFYHADGNGNIAALVNDKQAVVARYQYDPYGNIITTQDLFTTATGFTRRTSSDG